MNREDQLQAVTSRLNDEGYRSPRFLLVSVNKSENENVNVVFTRIENGCVPTIEFTEEMDELVFWLDETEHMINSNVTPADDDALGDLLEKVKVSENVPEYEARSCQCRLLDVFFNKKFLQICSDLFHNECCAM